LKDRGEKIVKGRMNWRKVNEIRKLRYLMTAVAVILCISAAAGVFFAVRQIWVQRQSEAAEASRLSAAASAAAKKDAQSQVTVEKEYLILVNPANPLPENYVPRLSSCGDVLVDERIVSDLNAMTAAAEKDGCPLKLVSGYVDAQAQEEIYQAEVKRLMTENGKSLVFAENEARSTVGRGGYSESQTGFSVAFAAPTGETGTGFRNTEQYHWLIRSCVDYGFVLRYPAGKKTVTGMEENPALFRYVGRSAAMKMREYSMCLEEYVSYLSNQGGS
jgi:D-alanyl-D-alanine carboxypeptidase